MNCGVCGDEGIAKNLCSKHYQRAARGGDVSVDRRRGRPQRPCSVDGCAKRGPHKGALCAMHAARLRKHGDVNAITRRADGQGTIISGYKVIFRPGHPNAKSNGQIFEHRYVMAEKLGRALRPEENVHHVNGDKVDNRPENLELWVKSQPPGQRPQDLVAWAWEIIGRYGG